MLKMDLTKINQRFEELDRATQLRLFEAFLNGKEIQTLYSTGEWRLDVYPLWAPYAAYRVAPEQLAPEQLIPDSIDWSHVADHLVCMARDESGKTYGFAVEPVLRQRHWHPEKSYFSRIDGFLASYRRGTVDWRDSLVWRPGHGESLGGVGGPVTFEVGGGAGGYGGRVATSDSGGSGYTGGASGTASTRVGRPGHGPEEA